MKIDSGIVAKPVPRNLNCTTLASIEAEWSVECDAGGVQHAVE